MYQHGLSNNGSHISNLLNKNVGTPNYEWTTHAAISTFLRYINSP